MTGTEVVKRNTALAYGVRSAPTMILFKRVEVQATQMRLVSKPQLTTPSTPRHEFPRRIRSVRSRHVGSWGWRS